MQSFEKAIELRWSDLDPNFHLRHSAYYDFGAFSRISFLNEHGMTAEDMVQHSIGPVLFREEAVFRKEIKLRDKLVINLQLVAARKDFSRWTIQHQLLKDQQLAAIITVDGAWLNTSLRKLTALPEFFHPAFDSMPKSEKFEWIVK